MRTMGDGAGRWGMAGLVALAFLQAASGQIEVGCRLETSRVLLYEPIRAQVRVANNTGRALQFGGRNPGAKLTFAIEQAPGEPVFPTDVPMLKESIELAPGEAQEWTFDLLSAYAIRSTGPYTIQGRVEWGEQSFLSSKVFLDVLPGLDVGRLAVGLTGSARETRLFTLKTLTRDRTELLFLRVDDESSGRCLGVLNLGRIVRQFRPQMETDGRDHVHVLHQSSPWKFTHTEINPDGIPVGSKNFDAYSTEVRFEKTADGLVEVRGIRPPQDPSLFNPPATLTPEPAGRKKRR